MPNYIDKAELVGDRLTNSDMQRRVREMTGTEVYHEVLRIINEMPAAEVEPVRHGRWAANELGYLVCTSCAWVRYGVPLAEHYPYCPNCGARMNGGADND